MRIKLWAFIMLFPCFTFGQGVPLYLLENAPNNPLDQVIIGAADSIGGQWVHKDSLGITIDTIIGQSVELSPGFSLFRVYRVTVYFSDGSTASWDDPFLYSITDIDIDTVNNTLTQTQTLNFDTTLNETIPLDFSFTNELDTMLNFDGSNLVDGGAVLTDTSLIRTIVSDSISTISAGDPSSTNEGLLSVSSVTDGGRINTNTSGGNPVNFVGDDVLDIIPVVNSNGGSFQFNVTEADPVYSAWDKDYNDLINTPTIPSAIWTESGSDIYYNSGNVGIGTSSPGTALNVKGDITFGNITDASQPILEHTGSGNAAITMAGTSGFTIQNTASASFRLLPFSNDIYFQNNLSTGGIRFTGQFGASYSGNTIFNTSGNIGIGTSTPDNTLDVKGDLAFGDAADGTQPVLDHTGSGNALLDLSGSAGFTIENTAAGSFRLLPAGNDIYFQNNLSTGGIRFTGQFGATYSGNTIFNTTGNVGIGTTAPSAKLDVIGEVEISDYTGGTATGLLAKDATGQVVDATDELVEDIAFSSSEIWGFSSDASISGTKSEVDITTIDGGNSSYFTVDAATDSITINDSGIYRFHISFSISNAGASSSIRLYININGTVDNSFRRTFEANGTTDTDSEYIINIPLTAGDVVDFEKTLETGSGDFSANNITITRI